MGLLQFLHAEVAEFDMSPVSAEADEALLPLEARVFALVEGRRRAGFLDVPFGDCFAVQNHFDMLAVTGDLLSVPFTGLLEETSLAGENSVNGAVRLVILETLIGRVVVVENLDFHADEGGIPLP